MDHLGKHTAPNEKRTVRYLTVGLIALLLAGGAYFGVTRISSHLKNSKETIAVKESQTSSKEKHTASKPAQTTPQSREKQKTAPQSAKRTSTSKKTADPKKKTRTAAQIKKQLISPAKELTESAGKVYYGVYYFNDKQEFSSENSEPTIAADIIELFIMEYALAQKDGKDQIIQEKRLSEWLTPMIQQNDRDATNVLIDHYGMDNLNTYFKEQGYLDTRIEHRIVDINVRIIDRNNYTSLNDCLKLLKKIYTDREKDPQKFMLELLTGQTIRTKIPQKIPTDVPVANISGEQQNVENDAGLVLTKDNPFAIVVLTQDVSDIVKIRSAIADFSLAATK